MRLGSLARNKPPVKRENPRGCRNPDSRPAIARTERLRAQSRDSAQAVRFGRHARSAQSAKRLPETFPFRWNRTLRRCRVPIPQGPRRGRFNAVREASHAEKRVAFRCSARRTYRSIFVSFHTTHEIMKHWQAGPTADGEVRYFRFPPIANRWWPLPARPC